VSKAAFTQKTHEQEVDFFRNWLCDTTPITVYEGLDEILSNSIPYYALKELQIRYSGSKLMKSISFEDGIAIRDGIVTLISDFNIPNILAASVRSRPQFVKLIYQSISCFPTALYDAYKEITEENLRLDDLSELREFYEYRSQIDLWTAQEFCAYISHCSSEALDFISEHPEMDFMSDDPEIQEAIVIELGDLLPGHISCFLLRPDLYKHNLAFLKAAILGGAFEIAILDRDNWEKSSLKPQKGLEWAKKKGIGYHPVLDELLLDLNVTPTTPAMASGYTTPYLEMMGEVIREQEISKENQEKKEAIAALFVKKLADHKLTPPSQKLADAMATLVRLPESQQGRAKYKE
jgi:hypothetical protein